MGGNEEDEKEYTPVPYAIRDKNGRHVSIRDKAKAKAEYLATEQWGSPGVPVPGVQLNAEDSRIRDRNRDKYKRIREERRIEFRTADITENEVRRTIKNLKRNKAPGPDGIHTEMMKWLDDENIRGLTTLMNKWWNGSPVE